MSGVDCLVLTHAAPNDIALSHEIAQGMFGSWPFRSCLFSMVGDVSSASDKDMRLTDASSTVSRLLSAEPGDTSRAPSLHLQLDVMRVHLDVSRDFIDRRRDTDGVSAGS